MKPGALFVLVRLRPTPILPRISDFYLPQRRPRKGNEFAPAHAEKTFVVDGAFNLEVAARPAGARRPRRLESVGVIFVEENGEGPGVRLRKKKLKSK